MNTPLVAILINGEGRISSLIDQNFLKNYKLEAQQLLEKTTEQLPKSPISSLIHNITSLVRERPEPLRLTTQLESSTGPRTLDALAWPSTIGDHTIHLSLCDTTQERRAAEEAVRQEKINSLSSLSRGVAHSINNALVGIIGHAALAEQTLPPYHAARFNIEQLLKAADQITELASQLMIYAGNHDASLRRANLAHVIKENLPLLQAVLPGHVKIHIEELSEDAPNVMLDIKILQQGLMATISAVASSVSADSSAEISLRVKPEVVVEDADEVLTLIGKIPPGSYALLHLSLPGGHVKASDLRQWFDPFFHARQNASVIGPAALLAATRLHNGGLNAYVDYLKTLHIRVLLPEATPQEQEQEAPQPLIEFKPEGIALIIDDEQAVRDVAREMLTQLGFEVLAAETGEAGLELATKHIEKLSLVVLDLHMPSLGGAETFRGLRLVQPNLRILISSGYSKNEAMRQFPNTEGTAFLQKPYRIPELEAAVRELFTRRL